MKFLILISFLTGLCVVSCDKPDPVEIPDIKPGSTKPARHGRQVLQEKPPEQPANHRVLLESALRIESPAAREKALAAVAWNTIEIDPETAHEAFLRLQADSPEKIRLIQHYAMRLAEQHQDEAVEWAAALGTECEIATAMSHVALEIAEADPHRAADILSEYGISGRDFDVTVVQVIQRWAAQSPPAAADWISSFPPGAARVAGITAIVERWLPRDPPGAFGWIDRIQDTELRTEIARATQGVILQQTQDTREDWLRHTDTGIRSELEQLTGQAILDVGNNIPPQGELSIRPAP